MWIQIPVRLKGEGLSVKMTVGRAYLLEYRASFGKSGKSWREQCLTQGP
jgi:hypothetical protein